MVKEEYIPSKGDLVILSFDPQSGHEQKGRRPALIVSNHSFNKAVGFALACPIANTDRGFPFHVRVDGQELGGFVLTEQLKSVDYRARKIKFVEKANDEVMEQVMGIIGAILS